MANENDASRDKKLLVGLIALVCTDPKKLDS